MVVFIVGIGISDVGTNDHRRDNDQRDDDDHCGDDNDDLGPRSMKQTLASKHIDTVRPYHVNCSIDPAGYRDVIKDIHTSAVADTITSMNHSRLLEGPHPDAFASEKTLSCAERSILAQLRTGECHLLMDYQTKVGRADSALCPEGRFRCHTAQQLFSGDSAPTKLSTRDLWENLVAAVEFLKTLPSFSRMVSSNAAAPRPPREPPPSGPPRVS